MAYRYLHTDQFYVGSEINDSAGPFGTGPNITSLSRNKNQCLKMAIHSCGVAMRPAPHGEAASGTPQNKQIQIAICTLYLIGLRQGIEVTEQAHPHNKTISKQEKRSAEEMVETMQKLAPNAHPLVMPDRNVCIPEDVTNDQMRLVVIKWMKDHPELLSMHAAHLGFAAITSTWPCSTD